MTATPDPDVSPALARALLTRHAPEWAHLPISRVVPSGWTHHTFRLGEELTLRLPRAECYAEQVVKEHRWLPQLARAVPLPIPTPLLLGPPDHGYPFPWAVYRWIEGDTASAAPPLDRVGFARELASFLEQLARAPVEAGPPPGPHNFYRGGVLAVYDEETRACVDALGASIDRDACLSLWDAALSSPFDAEPCWIHGDVAATNILVRQGRLSAVIDFGNTAVGDPACDLTIAWTFFSGASRKAYAAGRDVDRATWLRARAWAMWKALLRLASPDTDEAQRGASRGVLEVVLRGDPG